MTAASRCSMALPHLAACCGRQYASIHLPIPIPSKSTMSDTHYDATTSVLYCVAGVKIIYLAHPNAPNVLGLQFFPGKAVTSCWA